MAVVAGTVQAVELVRGPDDAYGNEIATGQMLSASLSIWNDTSSVVNAGTPDTLDVNAATAIQNARRDGKTVTVRTAAIVQTLVVGSTAYAGTITLSSNTVKITPQTAAWSGTPTIPANTTETKRYYRVVVGYTVA
ncbi:MAG: hypothetical protein EBR82_88735 [Caulobacteraceae bacterium]|nr:hypothetical protein [Caulobacteraceae bacterium]